MDQNKNGLAAFGAAVLLAAIVLSLFGLLVIGGVVYVATSAGPAEGTNVQPIHQNMPTKPKVIIIKSKGPNPPSEISDEATSAEETPETDTTADGAE